ncbi:MAG: hypothetical protein Nk1A_7700 [Endomicrobiia bacterium]|nr:MAG: hypothetical protein Nk1A_7700 [Endomicrobiia bacterium]
MRQANKDAAGNWVSKQLAYRFGKAPADAPFKYTENSTGFGKYLFNTRVANSTVKPKVEPKVEPKPKPKKTATGEVKPKTPTVRQQEKVAQAIKTQKEEITKIEKELKGLNEGIAKLGAKSSKGNLSAKDYESLSALSDQYSKLSGQKSKLEEVLNNNVTKHADIV